MLSRERAGRILALAIPILGGMVSQTLLNLVDTAMVGHLGDAAIGALGLGSFAFFMAIAVVTGIATGVQTLAARRHGQERHDETAVPLNGGLLLVFVVSLPWMLCLQLLSPAIFGLLSDDPAVVELGSIYLATRLWALPAIGMNHSWRGFWTGIGKPSHFLVTVVSFQALNVLLDWLLIYGHAGFPELGVQGAAVANVISTWVGLGIYFLLGARFARGSGLLRRLPDRASFASIVRIGLPSSAQQFLFAAGMVVFLHILGRIGTAELAASKVIIDIILFAILPGMGFGLAASTLVSQSIGAGRPDEAERWAIDVAKLTACFIAALSLAGIAAARPLLGLFLHDEATAELGRLPLILVALSMPIDVAGVVFLNAFLGAGDSRRVVIVSGGLQWVAFLPLAWGIGPVLGFGVLGVWLVQVVYRVGEAMIYMHGWRRGTWKQIRV